jgi:hypothetical protein
VLSGKYRVVPEDEFDYDGWREYGQDERLYFGMDFGFSTGPVALLRMWRYHHKVEINGAPRKVTSLVVTHEAYGGGV